MHKVLIFLLILSACLMTGCQNKNNTDTYSSAKLNVSSAEETSYDIYDTFTPLEIEQMEYSQKAIFSLTTDYDGNNQSPVAVGDKFTVSIKLTNMTDKTIKVTMLPPPEIILISEENVNPVCCLTRKTQNFFTQNAKSLTRKTQKSSSKTLLLLVYSKHELTASMDVVNLCLFYYNKRAMVWRGCFRINTSELKNSQPFSCCKHSVKLVETH